jgi:RNA polymerase sigma factor (TIGR02999 family)
MPSDADLTGLLQAWSHGDADALEALAPLVHSELRATARRLLAGERSALGWQATDLVGESYLRLLEWRGVRWENRAHFYGTAARMMRRILVDAARARQAAKRSHGAAVVPLNDATVAVCDPPPVLLELEQALQALTAVAPRAGQVVELRFFGGFTVDETAAALGISARTVMNDWNSARAWLYEEMHGARP